MENKLFYAFEKKEAKKPRSMRKVGLGNLKIVTISICNKYVTEMYGITSVQSQKTNL